VVIDLFEIERRDADYFAPAFLDLPPETREIDFLAAPPLALVDFFAPAFDDFFAPALALVDLAVPVFDLVEPFDPPRDPVPFDLVPVAISVGSSAIGFGYRLSFQLLHSGTHRGRSNQR
jgi:hypothetical protein